MVEYVKLYYNTLQIQGQIQILCLFYQVFVLTNLQQFRIFLLFSELFKYCRNSVIFPRGGDIPGI